MVGTVGPFLLYILYNTCMYPLVESEAVGVKRAAGPKLHRVHPGVAEAAPGAHNKHHLTLQWCHHVDI